MLSHYSITLFSAILAHFSKILFNLGVPVYQHEIIMIKKLAHLRMLDLQHKLTWMNTFIEDNANFIFWPLFL